MSADGFSFVARPEPTDAVSLAKMKEQVVSSFHLRAKKLFGNGYFVSSIVIPDDNTYPGGRCPGVPDQESQSPGSDYLVLLKDIYFTKVITVDGHDITQVDSHRKASADICKGDFSAALEPLKSFITQVPKNRYKLYILPGREIHSVELTQDGKKKILAQKDWTYNGSEIVFDADTVSIGDEVTVNLTVPKSLEFTEVGF